MTIKIKLVLLLMSLLLLTSACSADQSGTHAADTTGDSTAGDLILYQGRSFVIYYGNNNWSLTRLSKIENVNKEELLSVFGTGDVTVTLSLE